MRGYQIDGNLIDGALDGRGPGVEEMKRIITEREEGEGRESFL